MGDLPGFGMELIVGARNKQEVINLDAFLSAYLIIPFGVSTGGAAYRLLRTYSKCLSINVPSLPRATYGGAHE